MSASKKLVIPPLQINPTSQTSMQSSTQNQNPGVSQIIENLPIVQPSDLLICECLGHGATSTVYRAIYQNNGKSYALKAIKFTDKTEIIQTLVNELQTQSKLNHENVVHLFSAFYFQGRIHILMQFIDGASLGDYLKIIPTIPEPALGYLTWQSLQGLLYLRQHHVIHRDLKPSNILLSRDGVARIADFGMAKQLRESSELSESFVGTICYMAPERLSQEDYSFVSDIWSFGLITYESAIGKFPFQGDPSKLNYWNLFAATSNQIKVELPPSYSEGLKNFITLCLQPNQYKRATVEQLIEDPWVNKYKDPSNIQYVKAWIDQCEAKKRADLVGKKLLKDEFGVCPE